MGKIFLTNSNKWNSNLKECFKNAGFEENGYIKKEYYLTTYSKLSVDTENLYVDNNDFVACCGTMIYKSMIGKKALVELLADLKNKQLKDIRKDMLGSYAVIYSIDNELKCFIDETGTYALYYYNCNGEYIFTNTYYHIERETKQELNALCLLERHIENCIVGAETPFKNIYRVLADELIIINNDTKNVEKRLIEANIYHLNSKEIVSIAKELNDEAKGILEKSKLVLNKPQLFLTGGVDSRLILGNYLAIGIEPTLGAWYGAPMTMNTKDEDYKTVIEIATHIGVNSRIYDMSEEDIYNDISVQEFDKFGEYATIYNNNSAWHSILSDKTIQYADYGYFGETLKEWNVLDGINNKRVSLDWFVEKYISRFGLENPEKQIGGYDELYKKLRGAFSKIAISEQIDEKNMSREDCMCLYYWYRLYADTLVYQYANMYCYAYPLYAQKRIADMINGVPYIYKENEKLNLQMQQLLDERLLEIPFYSHCQHMKFDRDKMLLTAKLSKKIKVKQRLSSILKSNRIGKKILAIYRKKMDNIKDTQEHSCIDIVLSDLYKSNSFNKMNVRFDNRSTRYIPSMLSMVQECKMTDLLLKKDLKVYNDDKCKNKN